MIDSTTIFLMGWCEAQAGRPKEGPPYPCDPRSRQAWLAGYDAFKDGKSISISALKKWGRWDV